MSIVVEMTIAGKYMCWAVGPDTYKLVTYGKWSQRVNRYLDDYYPTEGPISKDSEPVFKLRTEIVKKVLRDVFRDRRLAV